MNQRTLWRIFSNEEEEEEEKVVLVVVEVEVEKRTDTSRMQKVELRMVGWNLPGMQIL